MFYNMSQLNISIPRALLKPTSAEQPFMDDIPSTLGVNLG